jgi:hypothetical protein
MRTLHEWEAWAIETELANRGLLATQGGLRPVMRLAFVAQIDDPGGPSHRARLEKARKTLSDIEERMAWRRRNGWTTPAVDWNFARSVRE